MNVVAINYKSDLVRWHKSRKKRTFTGPVWKFLQQRKQNTYVICNDVTHYQMTIEFKHVHDAVEFKLLFNNEIVEGQQRHERQVQSIENELKRYNLLVGL